MDIDALFSAQWDVLRVSRVCCACSCTWHGVLCVQLFVVNHREDPTRPNRQLDAVEIFDVLYGVSPPATVKLVFQHTVTSSHFTGVVSLRFSV